MTTLAVSANTLWAISLGIGLVGGADRRCLLAVLVRTVDDIERSARGLLEVAGEVAGNTANIPQLQATAPVLGADRGRGRGAGPLYERAHRRVRRVMSDTDVLVLLSVLLAVVVVAVVARGADPGPQRARVDVERGSSTLAGALETVESEHLRPLEPAVQAINAQFDVIVGAMPGHRRQGRGRGREEAAMTLWWIGDVLLLAVVLPVVVYLLKGVLDAARSIVPSVHADRRRRRARGRRTSTRCRCCSRRRRT